MPVFVCGAVRSEVLDSMGAAGQEVDRLVYDKGVKLSWHLANRSMRHPLLDLLRRKLSPYSEGFDGDILMQFFPKEVSGEPLDVFLLDRSFYKPRDLMWRLKVAQEAYPDKSLFDEEALRQTEGEYSRQMWNEVSYELNAIYSDEELQLITMALSGSNRYFSMEDVAQKFKTLPAGRGIVDKFLREKGVARLLGDLYRLGAVGNSFRVGSRGQVKNRWIFRGDSILLHDKEMELNPALSKHLSAVDPRRRGKRKKT